MILKLANNEIINWDNVTSIHTDNMNTHAMFSNGKHYCVDLHRGDKGFNVYPFCISIKSIDDYKTIYRTDSVEEMQDVYNAILSRIAMALSTKSSMCDLSDLTKNHDLYTTHITTAEYEAMIKESEEEE